MSNTNKELIARWFDEVWNQGKAETIHELLHEDAVIHDAAGDIHGPDSFKAFYDTVRQKFSDVEFTLHHIMWEDDYGCARWSVAFKSKKGDQPLVCTGMVMARIENGRFKEAWQNWDELGVTRELNGGAMMAHWLS